MAKYIIGTRDSLLATTQCNQIKEELEKVTGQEFELKTFKTTGDLNTKDPLWQMDGKDFFTKELDYAMKEGEVDLVVHSYKDLGSDRPDEFNLAAITKRDISHDILLIKNETIKDLPNKDSLVVGTSSPRRIYNITNFLAEFIPAKPDIKVSTDTLRGNVNTRIKKLRDDKYDAIVLAFAGLNRLAKDKESAKVLAELLDGLNFMVMPQSIFPAAASQGALAIECLASRKDLIETISKVGDPKTIEEVSRERKAFLSYGGGCHLAVGINVVKKGNSFVHIERGETDSKKIHKISTEIARQDFPRNGNVFLGLPKNKLKLENERIITDSLLIKEAVPLCEKPSGDLYFTNTYSIDAVSDFSATTLWSAGKTTWKKLVKKGHWVNGSSDGLGDEYFREILEAPLLKHFGYNKLSVFTNNESASTLGQTIPSYKRKTQKVGKDQEDALQEVKICYWTSFFQYQTYIEKYPTLKNVIHCCGLGKTYDEFLKRNIKVEPFFNMDEFYQYTNLQ